MHAARLVGRFDTADIGRHVAEHKVGLAPGEGRLDRLQRRRVAEVAAHKEHAGNRLHRHQVHRDDPARGPQALAQNLAPAARSGAQVDHRHARAATACRCVASSISLNAARER